MDLSNLLPTTKRKRKRLGRGYGSGKGGHTVGRGQKGQKSRSGGGPKKIRDYGKEKGFQPRKRLEPKILSVGKLDVFKAGAVVDARALVDEGLIRDVARDGVKILGDGELAKKLTIRGLMVSEGARRKIEEAGGKVEN